MEQDLVERLRIMAKNFNAKSLNGRDGDLLDQAANEIVKLRATRDELEAACQKGYAEAYEIISDIRSKMVELREEADTEYEKLHAELLNINPKVIGWAIEEISLATGTAIYSIYSNNSYLYWTEDGDNRDVTAEEYVELEVDYRKKRFEGAATYRIFPVLA